MRNRVRIIGGTWRGSRIDFPGSDGLRPTPERLRETVFNWLAPVLAGARCLDLFAGSGALGLEALSRGAAQAVFVERDADADRQLRAAITRLGARGADVVQAEALEHLRGPGSVRDIVFLDTPFGHDLIASCCRLLDEGQWLAPGALIYVECERSLELKTPPGWRCWRESQVGASTGRLLRRGT